MFQLCRCRVTFILVILGLLGSSSSSTQDGDGFSIIMEDPQYAALRQLLALSQGGGAQSEPTDVDFIDPTPPGAQSPSSPVDPDPVTLAVQPPPPPAPPEPLEHPEDAPRVSLLDIIKEEAEGGAPVPEQIPTILSDVELQSSTTPVTTLPPVTTGGGSIRGGVPGGIPGRGGVRTGPIYAPPPGVNGSLPSGVGTLPTPGVGSLPGGGAAQEGLRIGPPSGPPPKLESEPISQPEEGEEAAFFGEDPPDNCTCSDAVPSGAFNCMQVRFQEQCALDSIMDSPPDVPEGFCEVTCGRCDCCTDMLTMASRRGLDTFRTTLQIMAEAEGSRSIARSLQNPSFSSTVFAPTNDAFARMLKVLKMSPDEFLQQPSLINQIMTYHVLLGPTAATSEELSTGFLGTTLPTVNAAAFVTLNATGPVMQLGSIGSSASVLIPDIFACKAIFHVIDEVLLPFSTEGL